LRTPWPVSLVGKMDLKNSHFNKVRYPTFVSSYFSQPFQKYFVILR
jgi:hypothetical protein